MPQACGSEVHEPDFQKGFRLSTPRQLMPITTKTPQLSHTLGTATRTPPVEDMEVRTLSFMNHAAGGIHTTLHQRL